jgi:predicted DNA-binding transcriptional regulator AlpA
LSKEQQDFLGLAEVAELLGTSTRQAHRWSRREDFPEPLARLRATSVWDRSEVLAWAERLPLKRGPRPRAERGTGT